jgi:hypothetical protein
MAKCLADSMGKDIKLAPVFSDKMAPQLLDLDATYEIFGKHV